MLIAHRIALDPNSVQATCFARAAGTARSKDFDDAISYKLLENGNIEIGVHIADVTHYLKERYCFG